MKTKNLKFSQSLTKKIAFVMCCVMLVGLTFAFAACMPKNDYDTFEDAKAAALAEGKPILLYISKKPCPNCTDFKPDWINARAEYGDKVIFYVTTIGVNNEANDLYNEYKNVGPGNLTGSPGLVWISFDGVVKDKATGFSSCSSKIWGYFENGLEGWWTNGVA